MTPVVHRDLLSLLVDIATYPPGTVFDIGWGSDLSTGEFYRCAECLPGREHPPGDIGADAVLYGVWVRPTEQLGGCAVCGRYGCGRTGR